MIENVVISLAITIFGVLLGFFLQQYWFAITHWFSTTTWKHSREMKSAQEGLKSLATDLSYWNKKLGDRIVILRLLPFEFTRPCLNELHLRDYKQYDMELYKDTIIKIIREGDQNGVGYWDASIFGLCQKPEVDTATSYALNAMYFPSEPDPMDPDFQQECAVNTSILGLTRSCIEKGIFLIGKSPPQAKPGEGTVPEFLDKVIWKVGYTFEFKSAAKGFRHQYPPHPCKRTTLQELMKEYTKQWCATLQEELLKMRVDVPEQNLRTINVIAIKVDNVDRKSAKKWRKFIETWYSSESIQ